MANNIVLVTFTGLAELSIDQLSGLQSGLPSADKERASALTSERRRRQFVLGRTLLQAALLKFCQLPMQMQLQSGGKPEVEGACVSISHSGDSVAIALCAGVENPLGVDIEVYKSRQFMRLARHYFAPEEVSELEGLSSDKQQCGFFKFWVLKESLAKFTGKGLGGEILRSTFSPYSQDSQAVSLYTAGSDYALALTAAKDAHVDSYEVRVLSGELKWRQQVREFTRWSPPSIAV